ncbi:MAG TPA: SgcJ/EcaC family oxidoreductase [Candidatus Margulisiibacteriota bacterium]|nr:SgcJ/EcaC family oxidoreductase [Candidatus Margulisiibacteriota bacterium]
MRQLLIVVALASVAATAVAQTPAAKSDAGRLKSDVANEEAIRKLYDQFVAAWNKHDTKAMAAMWVEDGDDVEPDGNVAKGRGDVEKLLAMEHSSVMKNTKLALTIDSVWFITANVALVDGTYEVTGVVAPDGKELPPRKGRLSSIFLQERDKWWIAASRLMIPEKLPWRPS